ncbi:MAG: ABC transporter ATP-binding protein [Alphaproteobacteria bacterium]|nr:ABC transporter ATP-binding protein [Alphaproteobacteria bacterium]
MQIELAGIAKRFVARGRVVEALAEASLTVARGEFVALIGPSGCGKSTLLNMVAGLMRPSAGSVRYAGRAVSDVNRDVGYMTQADALLPWRTAEANVMLPLLLRGVGRQAARDRAREQLARVGLAGFADAYPRELSGGMRKRAALAQLLVYEPETLLLDEPFGALDAQLKLVLAQELAQLHARTAKTVLFVTHDLGEAIALADRVVVFTGRPGRLKRMETIELPRPRDMFRVRFEPRFQAHYESLWDALAPEIREVA